jgi:hypothetical protein
MPEHLLFQALFLEEDMAVGAVSSMLMGKPKGTALAGMVEDFIFLGCSFGSSGGGGV